MIIKKIEKKNISTFYYTFVITVAILAQASVFCAFWELCPKNHRMFKTPEMHKINRQDELSQLAKECLRLGGQIAEARLCLICLLITRDIDPESEPTNECELIASAFLHTRKLSTITQVGFRHAIRCTCTGELTSWYDVYKTEIQTITLKDLIAHCYGVSYMEDEYVKLFGAIGDDDDNVPRRRNEEPEVNDEDLMYYSNNMALS